MLVNFLYFNYHRNMLQITGNLAFQLFYEENIHKFDISIQKRYTRRKINGIRLTCTETALT